LNEIRKINLISNRNLESRKTSVALMEKLQARGFKVSEKYSPDAELNICVGGDGAFLRAVHRSKFSTIPFVGINTGNLGFFQEIKPEKIDDFIARYINNDYVVNEVFLVETQVVTSNKTYSLKAVNEIVVKGMYSKVVHLNLFISGNHLERFSGDGIIISTPAGSTAYNFSAGGSIVYPTVKALQITPIAPINSKAYRSLLNSTVVPGELIITIKPEARHKNSTLIVKDGIEFKYNNIKAINFRIPEETIYQLSFDKDNYWNNLKNKFL